MEIQNAGGVVVGVDGKLVIVEQQRNSWSLPKGGVEAGETPLEAAIREIREETGIVDLSFVCDLGIYERHSFGQEKTTPPLRRQIFLFRTNSREFSIDGKEITDARWVTIDEALHQLSHERDREFLASARSAIEACLN